MRLNFFSVISEEVQDAASIEQLSFVLRYCICIKKVSHTLYIVYPPLTRFYHTLAQVDFHSSDQAHPVSEGYSN